MPRSIASTSPATARGTRYIIVAISLTALSVIIWRISDVITVIFGGIVGAAVIRGLALPLARRTGLSSRWGVTLTMIGLLALVGALVWLFGQQVADEITEMQRLIPEAMKQVGDTLQTSRFGRAIVNLTKYILNGLDGAKTLSGVGFAAGAILNGVANAGLIFFLSVYLAFGPREYLEGFLRLLSPTHRQRVRVALIDAGESLRKWLLAQFVAMITIGVLVSTSLGLLHVPLALLLGTVAACLEFVPVIGPVLFTIPGLLVAFTHGPRLAFSVFLVYLVIQQVESNVIIPLLQRWALRLAPGVTLLSVVVGGLLFGTAGVILATPLAVVAMTLVKHLYVENVLERPLHVVAPKPVAAR